MASDQIQALFRDIYKYVDDAIAKALRGFKLPAAHISGVIGTNHGGTGTGDGTANPKGPAGGDLDGNYPDPTVDGIRGRTIASTAPADTQVLTWNDGANQWEPADPVGGSGTPSGPAGGDLYGTYPNPNVGKIRTLNVTSAPPFDGAILMWSATLNMLVWSSVIVTELSVRLVDSDGAYLLDADGFYLTEPA